MFDGDTPQKQIIMTKKKLKKITLHFYNDKNIIFKLQTKNQQISIRSSVRAGGQESRTHSQNINLFNKYFFYIYI